VRRGGRSSFRFRRGKRDYVWVTTRVDQVILDDEALSAATLVSPSDWIASSTGFDRGTIVAVRGWLSFAQTVAATGADNTCVMSYIAKNSTTSASAFSPLTATSYDNTDIMWCMGSLLQASLSGDRARWDSTYELNIKAKRKIDSSEVLQLITAMDTDTASPTAALSGIVRTLIQRA